MGKTDNYNNPRFGPISRAEWLEHANVGGEGGVPYKKALAPPVAYKSFPSLASGYTYHCIGPVGAASGASTWRVLREEKLTGTIEWANGNYNWDKHLTDLTAYSYS